MDTPTAAKARRYHAARIGLDILGVIAVAAGASGVALLVFHNLHQHFTGGLDGRIVYTALAAVTAACATDDLFGFFFSPLRERLVDARLELLIADVVAARHEHTKALVVDDTDLDLPLLAELQQDIRKAEDRALRAGALPVELS